MGGASEYAIGAKVLARDGECGQLNRVVVDPVARSLTHLVVQPKSRWDPARLVPIELAATTAQEIELRCTIAEFEALDVAEETHFLSEAEQLGYGAGETYAWPYYGLGSALGAGIGGGIEGAPRTVTFDRVPLDQVEVRRGECVHATDGDIGRLHGLVIDPQDHHVTHVLLREGHLWGKKEVAIPISAVAGVSPEGVHLKLTRDQVRDLPAVDLAAHD
jgi:sporulation protein YlmC with PRC-barrel domain